jgi:hypothetical protein
MMANSHGYTDCTFLLCMSFFIAELTYLISDVGMSTRKEVIEMFYLGAKTIGYCCYFIFVYCNARLLSISEDLMIAW